MNPFDSPSTDSSDPFGFAASLDEALQAEIRQDKADLAIDLTDEQANACNNIMRWLLRQNVASWDEGFQEDIATLAGAAGTGKTTCMRLLGADWRQQGGQVVQVAPTGKAAARLAEVTGRPAQTCHSLLYGPPEEDEGSKDLTKPNQEALLWHRKPGPVVEPGTLVICDEASMVGSELYRDLVDGVLRAEGYLLFVGDREQLSPVNDTWGVDWVKPVGLLETVHRQAEDSPIIRLATWIRENGDIPRSFPSEGDVQLHRRARFEDPAKWLRDHRKAGNDATLLCYTNRTRRAYNEIVRFARGLVPIDEKPGRIVPGDKVLVTFNNHAVGLMNGEVLTADHVVEDHYGPFRQVIYKVRDDSRQQQRSIDSKQKPVTYKFPRLFFGGPTREFREMRKGATRARDEESLSWVLGDYGECLTTHKSQGSEWDHVGLVWDGGLWGLRRRDPQEFRRWLYTAVTRARKTLTIWMLPKEKR